MLKERLTGGTLCVVELHGERRNDNNNKKHLNDVHVDCDISTGVDE